MAANDELIQKITDKFYNNCAGFVQVFTKIFVDPDGTPQQPYNKQLQFMNGIKDNERVITVVKSRQSGFTTSILARVLHESYFGKKNEILVASATERQAMRSLARLRWYFDSMPEYLRPDFVVESKQELKLANGTTIYSLPSNPTAMRGFTNASILLDEFGVQSQKDSEEIWEALLPVITKDGRIIVVSTPKGRDNMFYHLANPQFDDNGNPIGIQSDRIIRVNWTDVPHVKKAVIEYDLRNKMHPKQFAQEYELSFNEETEFSLFDLHLLREKFVDDTLQFTDISFLEKVDEVDSIRNEMLEKYPKGLVAGYDAAISWDGSWISIFGIKDDDTWELISLYLFPKNTEITYQVKFIAKVLNYFGVKKLGYDGTGALGKTVGSLLKEAECNFSHEPVIFTNQMKSEEYGALRRAMEEGKIVSPEHKEMIKQFTLLAQNQSTGRIAATGSHRTNHDDIPSSILCAFYCRNKRKTPAGITLYSPNRGR